MNVFGRREKQEPAPQQPQRENQNLAKQEKGGELTTKHGNVFDGYSEEEFEQLIGTTGTEDKPESERRPPLYSFNLDMIDEAGNKVSRDVFYNNQTGEQFPEINCALIIMKETFINEERNKLTGEKTILCQSYDRRTGMTNEGDLADCLRCQSRKLKKGERKKECTPVMRFLCFDTDRKEIFVINFKRTSYIPSSNYLQRNFFGQYRNPKTGKRGDIPLYLLGTNITLKPETSTVGMTYYVPVFKCTGPLGKDLVMDLNIFCDNAKKMTADQIVQEAKGGADQAPAAGDDDIPF